MSVDFDKPKLFKINITVLCTIKAKVRAAELRNICSNQAIEQNSGAKHRNICWIRKLETCCF